MYALIENGEITRINIQLPTVVGNTSIPKGATGLEEFGLYPIVGDEPKPQGMVYSEFTVDAQGNQIPVESSGTFVGDYNAVTHRIAGPQYVFDGKQVNRVFTVEVIPDAEKAAQVRAERNDKLAATDWRFRSDMTPSQDWIDYCAALRNVPEQAGFPWSVEWPEMP